MLVTATRLGDVELPGGTVKAVFPGQVYDIPDESALPGLTDGWLKKADLTERPAEAAEDDVVKAEEPAQDKAEEPASDKAVRAPRGTRRELK